MNLSPNREFVPLHDPGRLSALLGTGEQTLMNVSSQSKPWFSILFPPNSCFLPSLWLRCGMTNFLFKSSQASLPLRQLVREDTVHLWASSVRTLHSRHVTVFRTILIEKDECSSNCVGNVRPCFPCR